MARARQMPLTSPTARAANRAVGRSLHTTQAANDLAQLLRSRSFCLSGDGPIVARVAANLGASGALIDAGAAAWIGLGAAPEGRVAVALGDGSGALGPYSFGFLNNLDGPAPLAAPVAERPRRGSLAWVVPRRDALPEVVPLLCGRGLGVSWLISVGDGDPAEVLRFLRLDPATSAVLLALGRGVRAQSLREALGDKPAVLLEPPTLSAKESTLVRAVARRAGAVVTPNLEEWLAHAALLDVAAGHGPATVAAPSARARRWRAVLIVAGAGSDFVASEVQRLKAEHGTAISLRSVDSEDVAAIDAALRQAAVDAPVVLLCGPNDLLTEVSAPRPTLRIDLTQPERLRAVLQALALSPPQRDDDKPVAVVAERERLETVLADLPPPLYVGATQVSDEPLGDQDIKRLLFAYGVRVSRQAPANTATAALRILTKLKLPIELLPALPPQPDVEALLAAEASSRVLCTTQADVKRHSTLLLSKSPHLLLREVPESAPRVRLQASVERGIGNVLRIGKVEGTAGRVTRWEAALLPIGRGEARQLGEVLSKDSACKADSLYKLLVGVSACLSEHTLTLDLLVDLADEPSVVRACGVLARRALRKDS